MSLDSESLLMATGLLEVPTREHARAIDEISRSLETDLKEAFDRDEPARFISFPERKTYHDRMAVEPDYAEMLAALPPLVGDRVADEYVVDHQRARAALRGLRPRGEIDTVVGPVVVPLDALSQSRWELHVDYVEGARISKDIAAGAVLGECVKLFQACFPTWYKRLRVVEEEQLDKRRAKSPKWMPTPWLASALLTFEGRPPGGKLTGAGGQEPEPGKPTKEVKITKVTEALETATDRVGP